MKSVILIALAACGSSKTDSNVIVLASATDGHVENWQVYFQDADMTLIKSTVTNTNGEAAAEMSDGGFVTVIPPGDAINNGGALWTFADVAPGDRLRVGNSFEPPKTIPVAMTMTLDPANGNRGYDVFPSCGSEAQLTSFTTFPVELELCPGHVELLVLDGTNQLYQQVDSSAGSTTLDAPFTPIPEATYSYGNLPDGPELRVDRAITTTRGTLWRTEALLATGQPSISASLPAADGATYIVRTQVDGVMDQMVRHQTFVDWGPATTSYSLDYAAASLRNTATPPSYDMPSHAIVWSEASGSAVANAVITTLAIDRDGATPSSWSWQLVAPRGEDTRVVYPVLPVDAFDYNPGPGDNVLGAFVRSAKIPGGYDVLRPSVFLLSGTGFDDPITGDSGEIVYMDQ